MGLWLIYIFLIVFLEECLARVSSKRVLSRVPCKTLLLLDDCASHLHKEKTSIFISALVSVHSALHKVTAFGFVGSIRYFFDCFFGYWFGFWFLLGNYVWFLWGCG